MTEPTNRPQQYANQETIDLANIPYDLAGCELKPLKYDGRALRELTFTYSDAYANSTSRKGKPCLLNQCGDKAEK